MGALYSVLFSVRTQPVFIEGITVDLAPARFGWEWECDLYCRYNRNWRRGRPKELSVGEALNRRNVHSGSWGSLELVQGDVQVLK